MHESEIENEFEFEYIDLDAIDEREEDENPLAEVRFQRSADDEVFIVGVKL